MGKKKWKKVDRYISELFVPPDAALDAALAESERAGLPPIQVAPNQGKLLMLLAKSIGARRILEIGTLGGYSTIWLARALPAYGLVVTLEADPDYAEVAGANIERAKLDCTVELRVGPALETLPQIAAEGKGPFDLVFIDADKTPTPDYFEWALRLSRRGSFIVVDNVVREGGLAKAKSKSPDNRAMRRFCELAAADPRVCATVIQTVGVKGHDGLAIALVTSDP